MKAQATLFQLGTDLVEAPTLNAKAPQSRQAQTEGFDNSGVGSVRIADNIVKGPWTSSDDDKDHFITVDGVRCAGKHMIIDLWGAKDLDKLDVMEAAMRKCVEVCGATLLHIHLHHFQPNGGISGVAVLAESHISVHTWPEYNYAAFDVFMCGESKPELAVGILQNAFGAKEVRSDRLLRGQNENV
jgi:S-adenosylmethionine decarboxylase